jgi:WD40 repeat protein/serine/threonine protein kinase/tetratricopeptide (TPR) repeat protein
MHTNFTTVRQLFEKIVDRPAAEWEALLMEACPDDAEVRSQVMTLLKAHAESEGVLDRAAQAEFSPELLGPMEKPGTIIGPYKLLEQIGEGGMGTVWVAEQTQPVRRKVALKLIKAGMDSKTVLARFAAERQALALMDHPNIAKVLDGGTVGQAFEPDSPASSQARKRDLHYGRPFFVMELVKGIPLTKYCDEARLSVQERLALFMPVCHAVQHAHQKGIIHRDLKPSNILVCLYDGVPVPKVIDFGLAKAMYQPLTEHTLHTAQGLMMGTPLYMSPEQAEVNNLDVDTRSDIYSLGVILYELLTGTTPLERKRFKEAAWHEMLRLIKEEEPPRPSTRLSGSGSLPNVAAQRKLEPAKLTKLVQGDLDWIVMKALEKERGRRYETANGLARDIQNYLADEPVEATPPSASYRLRKFARKYKKALVTTVAFVVLLVAGLVASTLLAVWATSAEGEAVEAKVAADANAKAANANARAAEEAKQKEVDARDELAANLYVSQMNVAQANWENANVGRILELLAPYRQPPAGKPDPRGWEWYYQDRLCQLELRTLKGHTQSIASVAFNPDGSRLVAADYDGTIKVWDTASGQELRPLNVTGAVSSVAVSPGASRVASASLDGTIKVWDTISGEELHTLKGHTGRVRRVAFSPDGSRLVSASGEDGTIMIWDLATGKEPRTFKGHTGVVVSVAFSPDGSRLAGSDEDGVIKVRDATSGQELLRLKGHTGDILSMAFSPDGSLLASAGTEDRTIRVWTTASGQELLKLKGHTSYIESVAFSPDGSRLASASRDQTIKIWDTASGQELRTLKGHIDAVFSVTFSPDGSRLASASRDHTIKIWDTASSHELRKLKGHTNWVRSVAFNPDGSRLASMSFDPTLSSWDLKLWDTASGQKLRTLERHTGRVRRVAFSPDGSRLASASGEDGTIKVWDTASGQELLKLKGHAGSVWSVAFSPDGCQLVSASGEEVTIKVWDTASGQELRKVKMPTGPVRNAAFSPDLKRLASASDEGTIKVWDTANGQELRTLKMHNRLVMSVAFSPDGSRLALGSAFDPTLKVWDMASAQELPFKGHIDRVGGVAFSPDGSRLASASADGTIKIWDTANGQELRTLKEHAGEVWGVAFSADGNRLASASDDRTIHVYDARPWTPELRRQCEALGLVEYLCQKSASKEQITERIRADKGITEGVRREALTLMATSWHRHLRKQLADCMFDKKWDLAFQYAKELLAAFPQESRLYAARAEIECGQGRLAEAEADLRKADQLGDDPVPTHQASLAADLATAHRSLRQAYLSAGRTREAVPHMAKVSAANPGDTEFSLQVAALQAWFGQDKELAATRQRVLAFAKGTSDAGTAERAAQVINLLASTDKAQLEAALTLARKAVELGKDSDYLPFFQLALGIAEYRGGNDTAADDTLRAAASSPLMRLWPQPSQGPWSASVTNIAAFYRAMSLFRQGKEDEARKLATAAAATMKPLPKDENNPPLAKTATPELMMWVAYREARTMIQFDAAPPRKVDRGKH